MDSRMSKRLPVVYTAHHAGTDFGAFVDRTVLDERGRVMMADYGTELTVPLNGIDTHIASHSRALVDLHRGPNDPGRFFDRTSPREFGEPIWKPGQEPNSEERTTLHQTIWEPFHESILRSLRKTDRDKVVVAWDNAGPYRIGSSESGEEVFMKPFILSNHGREGSGEAHPGHTPSCDPTLLETLARNLRVTLAENNLPNEVHLNLVFAGGYIAEHYNTLRHAPELLAAGVIGNVHSFMVEYDGSMITNQRTLLPFNGKAEALRDAFSRAMTQTCELLSA